MDYLEIIKKRMLDILSARITAFENTLLDINTEMEEQRDRILKLNKRLKEQRERLLGHEQEIEKLSKIRGLRKLIRRLQGIQKKASEEIEKEIDELRKAIDVLSKELHNLKQSNQNNSVKKTKIQDIISESDKLRRKITEAESLRELGYRDLLDAKDKLSIAEKDYIIIPIPDDISDISGLFYHEKDLTIEFDGRKVYSRYISECGYGRINYLDGMGSTNSALMIPIKNMNKDDIDSIKKGIIGVRKSVLRTEGLIVITPDGRSIELGELNAQVKTYSSEESSIEAQIGDMLKEFFRDDKVVTKYFEVLEGIQNSSSMEEHAKREAVRNCIFENSFKPVEKIGKLTVNGEVYTLGSKDKRDIKSRSEKKLLNKNFLEGFINDVQSFLNDGKCSFNIDTLYGRLLSELFRVKPKEKAAYIEESSTTVNIDGKCLSFKPHLPADNRKIAKRYSRPNEDVIYKIMKLANLVNRFAHFAIIEERQSITELMFKLKRDLIERAIELAKDNPNVKLRKIFDDSKMAWDIVVEIPGYNMIALHILQGSPNLMNSLKDLKDYNGKTLFPTSDIFYPGVNKDFLIEFGKMDVDKRKQILIGLNIDTLFKLALRMGFSIEDIQTDSDKNNLINKMITSELINQLLGEEESAWDR